jgi:hypothetical protein
MVSGNDEIVSGDGETNGFAVTRIREKKGFTHLAAWAVNE